MQGEWGPGEELGRAAIPGQASLLLGTGRARRARRARWAMPGPASKDKACPCENEGGVNMSIWLSAEAPSAAPDKEIALCHFPPLLFRNKQTNFKFPNLIKVLSGDPAGFDIALGSGFDGASVG